MSRPPAKLFSGVCAQARAAMLNYLSKEHQTSVALFANPREAAELASEIRTHINWENSGLEVLYFPEDPPADIDAARRADRISERLAVLSALLEERRRIILTTPEALLGPCLKHKVFLAQRVRLAAGDALPFSGFVEKLTSELNYDSEALCEHPGQFSVRGGLVDIYPFDADRPYRIDFFGDEIETIRSFDPTSQLSENRIDSITIPAAFDSKHASPKEGAFTAYLPDSVQWILEDPSTLIREHPYRFEKIKQNSSPRSFYQLIEHRRFKQDGLVCICELDTDHELFDGAERIPLATEATENYRFHTDTGQIGSDRFESEQSTRLKFELQINDWAKEGLAIVFVTAGESEENRIIELLAENPVTAKLKPSFLHGTINGGYIYRANEGAQGGTSRSGQDKSYVVITDSEFFGRRQRKISEKRARARPTISHIDQLLDFTELADGDPLVHLQHGVCLFRGLARIDIQGGAKEVISVEFAEDMTIHVPLHESHLLTRYVGLNKAQPKLGKIGGSSWEKTRSAAERATLDYAAEMLNLHAQREQSGGYAFPPDHPWQRDFEAAFPFKETPDQLRAIDAAKEDMEKELPMDRLICGDVGFGKTEVAIRAALKAILAGKQVALLVPTTVLCQQHFNTFLERMAQYPIVVEMVSRFRTAKQNREIIAQLADGRIDIVIGTHRLLSHDVHFNNLGLLVVDE
ncbi:MAG: DEAD/DEAH box helicase, partial [Verrucomicrobiota bacterium]